MKALDWSEIQKVPSITRPSDIEAQQLMHDEDLQKILSDSDDEAYEIKRRPSPKKTSNKNVISLT